MYNRDANDDKTPLLKQQFDIMSEFYSKPARRVVFNKKERNALWKIATKRDKIPSSYNLNQICPALEHQILRSYNSENNIQSAVFSECVYAQTLANLFELSIFIIHSDCTDFLPAEIIQILDSYSLSPRYIFSNKNKSRMLIQAGSCKGIDSALISVIDFVAYTIEFKEQGAKTSEPDLPKYGEDGKLIITSNFQRNYPQFTDMLSQHIGQSVFDVMGKNIHSFSEDSIKIAVSENYITKKFADVCCTEDDDGYLVMLPLNQIDKWANIEGEIRPAGRNNYSVWTPNALNKFILDKGGTITNGMVLIDKSALGQRRERGGNRKVSAYKINELFFVRLANCRENNGVIEFDINSVRQLNPTIAGKVFFKNLKFINVKSYYGL